MKKLLLFCICVLNMININAVNWLKDTPILGFGLGANKSLCGNVERIGFTFEGICWGALISTTFTNADKGDDLAMKFNFHVGYLIPIKNFNNIEIDKYQKRLLITPIVEFSSIRHIKVGQKHKDTAGHICQWKIDESYTTDKKVSYGAGIMYQHSGFYGMMKLTNSSANLTIGFAYSID